MPTISRQKLADVLNVTEARISQLVADGVLQPDAKGRFDQDDATRKYSTRQRANVEGRDAKARLLRAQAARAEARTRRELKQLITPAELRAVVAAILDAYAVAIQRGSSDGYAIVSGYLGADEARSVMQSFMSPVIGARVAADNALRATVDKIETEQLRTDARVEDVYRALVSAACPTDFE